MILFFKFSLVLKFYYLVNTIYIMSDYIFDGILYGRMRLLLYQGRTLPKRYKKNSLRTSTNLLLLTRACNISGLKRDCSIYVAPRS